MPEEFELTRFYFMEYPDNLPEDPKVAYTEMRVEVTEKNKKLPADLPPGVDYFDCCFAFKVYTLGYIQENFFELGKPFIFDRSVIIVREFKEEIIKQAIKVILPNIAYYGELKDI